MATSELTVSLTIDLPNGSTRVLEFSVGDPIMVGSGSSASVCIEHEDVSSLHCMIKAHGDGLVVSDLGSDEGTQVNGHEATGDQALEDGDQITVGPAHLTVHFGGDMLAPTVPFRAAANASATDTTEDAQKTPAPAAEEQAVLHDRQRAALSEDQTVKVIKPEEEISPPRPASHNAAGQKKKSSESSKKKAGMASKKSIDEATEPTQRIERKNVSTKRGMPQSTRHDDHSGHHVSTSDLSPTLSEHEKANNVGHVEVTMLWGGSVMGVSRLSGSGAVQIGEADGSAFRISHPSIPTQAFQLVTLSAQGATIHVANGMELEVDKQGQAGASYTLQLGQTAVVRVGPVEFVIQYSQRYRAIDLGLFQALDFLYAKVFAVAMIFQVAFVVAMFITPKLDSDEDDDLFQNPNEFQALILKPEEKKKEKKEDLSGKKAARHKDDEGVFGKKDKPKEDKLASKAGAPKVDKDKREEDRKLAMDALAALGLKGPDGAVSNVLGPGGLGSGINNALGGLRGASMGDAGGAGGLGSRGTGAGGGGNALGIGGLGSGTGRGSGGRGGIDLGGRGKGMTRVQPGKVIHKGSLSREEIQRVISRVMNQIKFCYERELNKNPNLEGKLVASWVISGAGDVASANAAQNTMGSQPVEQCVMRIIKRLKFPQPKGGGQVFVTYPFVFSPSG